MMKKEFLSAICAVAGLAFVMSVVSSPVQGSLLLNPDNSSATFEQPHASLDLSIAASIDGVTGTTGWAISDGGVTGPETAFIATASAVTVDTPRFVDFSFTLDHQFSSSTLALGLFRISYTSDDISNPPSAGSSWITLEPDTFSNTGGGSHTIRSNAAFPNPNSILVTGVAVGNNTYTVTATNVTVNSDITGFRLEVLEETDVVGLPNNGPGLSTDGNFVLTTFAADVTVGAPIPEPASLAMLAIGGLMLLPRRKRHQ